MPIKGLTDRRIERRNSVVILGQLNKGGPKVKNAQTGKWQMGPDLDYLRFSPADQGELGERVAAAFAKVYGKKPSSIPDVRIPVDLAGNFAIEDCAHYESWDHTRQQAVFLARGDGERIYRRRSEETGKVETLDRPEPFDEDGFRFAGRVYPWSVTFRIALVLPDLNRELAREGISGIGHVLLTTSSKNDVVTLIEEYYGILDKITGMLQSATGRTALDPTRMLPLEQIPLMLFRGERSISTPGFDRNKTDAENAADRRRTNKSLLHWTIGAAMSLALEEASRKITERTIDAIANAPLLPAGRPAPRPSLAAENHLFFGTEKPAELAPGPELVTDANIAETVARAQELADEWAENPPVDVDETSEDELDGIFDEDEIPFEVERIEPADDDQEPESEEEVSGRERDEMDLRWQASAIGSVELGLFCVDAYQITELREAFDSADKVKMAARKLLDDPGIPYSSPFVATILLAALRTYAVAVIDGETKRNAFRAAARKFGRELEELRKAGQVASEEEE